MSDNDPLIEESGYGSIETAALDVDNSEKQIQAALKQLGVDRRSSMPDDEECLEYRLRSALDEINDVKEELADEVNYDL